MTWPGPARDSVHRLRLGPIVGHTDHQSTRIWIRVWDDPGFYQLRVQGRGLVDFAPTEPGGLEFGTAMAIVDGLRPDRRYRYQVLRRRRVIPAGRGSFQTMPEPGSMAEILFSVVSCSHNEDEGAWPMLGTFVEDAAPRLLLCIGDQVYFDQGEPDVWRDFLFADPARRRAAMAAKYQDSWSRPYVQTVLANVPTYMIWDDHEIRDGWGSFAGDSPTLAQQFPQGAHITETYRRYFEDARDVYWHFQACRNPLPEYVSIQSPPGYRRALPVTIRCGRLCIVMLDSRGDRDVFRADKPVLGQEQWAFLDQFLTTLGTEVDGLAVVTTVPIVSASPEGQWQSLLGGRTDDVEAYKTGDIERVGRVLSENQDDVVNLVAAALGGEIRTRFGGDANVGSFKVNELDDTRDQWSHEFSRPEQEALIRAVVNARVVNRTSTTPRAVLFVGGDLHVGGKFEIVVDDDEPVRLPCIISSGISKKTGTSQLFGTVFDQEFEVAAGMTARLQNAIGNYNYGVVQVFPTGHGAEMATIVVHEGNASSWGAELSAQLGP